MDNSVEKRTVRVFRDFDDNYYAIITILNKNKIDSIISLVDINKHQVKEFQKIDSSGIYARVKKSIKRIKKYKFNEKLFINHCEGIAANRIVRELNHFDFVLYYNNIKRDKLFISISFGKTSRDLNTARIFSSSVSKEYLSDIEKKMIACFSNFRIIESINDYLPLVYYSNSIRYINALNEIRKKIDSICELHKRKINKNEYVLNHVNEYKKEDDLIKENFKQLINNNKNISYSECIEFNSRCTAIQNDAEFILFMLFFELEIDESGVELNTYNIKTSRNDCVFYRGSTDMIYGCTPKIYREPINIRLENISYHEYVMRFPEIFDKKASVECITLMQHFGLSTRLLDITTNPLVALFMSCYSGFSKANDTNSLGEIIVFFPEYDKKNNDNQVKYYDSTRVTLISCLAHLDYEEKTSLKKLCASPLFKDMTIGEISKLEVSEISQLKGISVKSELASRFENGKKALAHLLDFVDRETRIKYNDVIIFDLMKSYYIKTPSNSERIKAQSGCFIISGLDPKYIDLQFKSSRNEKNFFRIIVADKQNILEELKQLNIHQASMTPDMQNVADYLSKNKY